MEKLVTSIYLRPGEIASFIREGMLIAGDLVVESRTRWLSQRMDNNKYECCAIGFLLIGKAGSIGLAHRMFEEQLRRPRDFRSCFDAMLKLTSIEPKLFSRIYEAHFTLRRPAAKIADELEMYAA